MKVARHYSFFPYGPLVVSCHLLLSLSSNSAVSQAPHPVARARRTTFDIIRAPPPPPLSNNLVHLCNSDQLPNLLLALAMMLRVLFRLPDNVHVKHQ